ncbi:MAG: hypothetical protein GXP27_16800, partial [Planctomycetes bacterium]|nr:hypothetical protein [Planctomycetota bacterium]
MVALQNLSATIQATKDAAVYAHGDVTGNFLADRDAANAASSRTELLADRSEVGQSIQDLIAEMSATVTATQNDVASARNEQRGAVREAGRRARAQRTQQKAAAQASLTQAVSEAREQLAELRSKSQTSKQSIQESLDRRKKQSDKARTDAQKAVSDIANELARTKRSADSDKQKVLEDATKERDRRTKKWNRVYGMMLVSGNPYLLPAWEMVADAWEQGDQTVFSRDWWWHGLVDQDGWISQTIDVVGDFSAGMASFFTAGMMDRYHDWTGTQVNRSGLTYKLGWGAGLVIGFFIGGGAGAACQVGRAATAARALTALETAGGAAQAIDNFAHGRGSVGDVLSLLPAVGYVMGRAGLFRKLF